MTSRRVYDPVYERREGCPVWCAEHTWDVQAFGEPVFTGHEATMGEAADHVVLYVSADGSNVHAWDEAGIERTPERLRSFAALLLRAADVLELQPDPNREGIQSTREEVVQMLARLGLAATDEALAQFGY